MARTVVVDDTFIDTAQLAARQHRTVESIHAERYRGDGPRGYKIGKRVLYKVAEVEQWEAAQHELAEPDDTTTKPRTEKRGTPKSAR